MRQEIVTANQTGPFRANEKTVSKLSRGYFHNANRPTSVRPATSDEIQAASRGPAGLKALAQSRARAEKRLREQQQQQHQSARRSDAYDAEEERLLSEDGPFIELSSNR